MPLLPREPDTFPDNLFSLPTGTDPWLVIHVRSRQEKVLARHLLRAGIPFYLPQVDKATKRAGRTFRSFVPLFPGYVFARGSAKARAAAWQSDVAANILPVDDQRLIDDELRQLRELQLSGASLAPHTDVPEGSPVRITDGAFAGYTGTVVRHKEQDRLIVTISYLHRAVVVDLHRDAVIRSAAG